MIIKTNLTRNYIPTWTVIDAMRELVQNAIDSDPDCFTLDYDASSDEVMLITNTALPLSSLYMGESSKRGDSTKLGVHGEGLKLALLILLREDRSPKIEGNLLIEPYFHEEVVSYENEEKVQVLAFKIDAIHYVPPIQKTIITFNANQDEFEALDGIVLPKDTPFGLLPYKQYEQSKLYLGGLAITSLGFKYSYNLEPGSIVLERDRRVADVDAVKEAIARIWLETGRWDDIVTGMLHSQDDFEGLQYIETPQDLIDACVKRAEEFDKPPMSYNHSSAQYHGTYVSNTFYSVYRRSDNAVKPTIRKQPKDLLAEWFKQNRSYFRKAGAKRFEALLLESKTWFKP